MNVLLFSGTSDGKAASEYLSSKKINTTVFVATDYGKSVMPDLPFVTVHVGRLDKAEIAAAAKNADAVIDATHPYAQIVTENIQSACSAVNKPYYRLVRDTDSIEKGITYADSIENAVRMLENTDGVVFAATGSKELEKYAELKDRLAVRVLPTAEAESKCRRLGIKNVIYKKGPFSFEQNVVDFKKYNAKWLVTKSSGSAGGYAEKIAAAKYLDINIITIKRPEEIGYNIYQIKKIIDTWSSENKLNLNDKKYMRFPLFVDISNKKAVVVGGGKIAVRRINTLLKYGADVTVVSPQLDVLSVEGSVCHIKKSFEPSDVDGAVLAVGAADVRDVNHSVYTACIEKSIPVSIADCREECTFYFPAVYADDDLSMGIVSDGENHSLVRRMAAKIRSLIKDEKNKGGQP